MSDDIFLDDDDKPRRRRGRPAGKRRFSGAATVIGGGVILAAMAWFVYSQFRIDVRTGHIALLIRKTGEDIPNSAEVAPDATYKGVQKEFLKEGRYFRNPWVWEWEIVPQIEIPDDKLGVLVSLTGDDLPYGEFLAKQDENGNWTKGIVPDVLKPGRHAINPYLFDCEYRKHSPVTIDVGFEGVVTNLAGPFPETPNTLLVEDGERGVQKKTLGEGTYYINPYVTRISQVDCRSQKFKLAENKDMGFPSKDGFWISLDGTIEFRVDPERAAEVFVTYNESHNGDAIDEEIIRKVILPNARSFCRLEGSNSSGREFISGDTKIEFQSKFQEAMRRACDPQGIEIIQALIDDIKPPQQIAGPVRDRQIAVEEEKNYVKQIEQQKDEQKLATKRELVKQGPALVKAEQDVVKLTVEAEREKEVALTKAMERKAVAQLRLDAAKDEASAIRERGRAEAEVVKLQNAAEAAGWKNAVLAFGGDGQKYSRYVLLQKMSSSYRRIMANTADSPIMDIFKSFTAEGSAQPGSEVPSTRPGNLTETGSGPAGETGTVPASETGTTGDDSGDDSTAGD